ncbi:hypothetical protein N865_16125 [Intrasporangium oryzae NRRL B-24470]|uniref:Uncharacterized protein n=1 Tax=Intrasporangium oryzae NRRL B-24470 TaxID=1386089 RepID=W9G4Z4_9MICO|nr:hypothetical protein [Intrasporangium oryzae]EWT00382.1 hypothetical protein N865_16125 [Intrasporangium oryzae NRRL B-24470]
MNAMDRSLREMLEERGEGVSVVVGDLAERAIERDRANRRREVGAGLLAAGLVLAVAVPVGWASLRPTASRPLPAGTSHTTVVSTPPPTGGAISGSPTPTTVPTITASGDPAPVLLVPTAGDLTATTDAAYAVNGVIHDGSQTVSLPRAVARPDQLHRVGAGWLVGSSASPARVLLDSSGREKAQLTQVMKVVVSPDRLHFVIATYAGDLAYYDSSGKRLARLPASTCRCTTGGGGGGYTLAGLVGTTVYAAKGDTGTSVAWDVTTGETKDLAGTLETVNEAQRIGLVHLAQTGPDALCHELRRLDDESPVWRLCGPLLFDRFSPDGTLLLATGIIDGLPHSALAPDGSPLYGGLVLVRTSDGQVAVEGRGIGDVFFDDDSRSITVEHGVGVGKQALSRCDLQGSCQPLAPAKPVGNEGIPELDAPYRLESN